RGPRRERDHRGRSREGRGQGRPRPHARATGAAGRSGAPRGGPVIAMSDLVAVVPPPHHLIRAIVERALDEDVAWGAGTTEHSVPADQCSRARLFAKQGGVLCGGRVFAETFSMLDARVAVDLLQPDGAVLAPGDVVASAEGPTRALLTGERTGLN